MSKLICTYLLVISSYLFAFEGFYAGGSLGAHFTEGSQVGRLNSVFTSAGFTTFYPSDFFPDMFDEDIAGIVYAGYGHKWRSFYLGAEGFLQIQNISLQNSQDNMALLDNNPELAQSVYKTKFNTSCLQGGIDFLPGWVANPLTLLYGRIGLGFAEASLDATGLNRGTLIVGGGVDNWNFPLTLAKSKILTTFRAGGGLEERFSSHLSLRADYIYTDYGKLSVQGLKNGSSGRGSSIAVSYLDSVHVYDHAVLLGLNYRFCGLDPVVVDPYYVLSAYKGFYVGSSFGGSILNSVQKGEMKVKDPLFLDFSQTGQQPTQLYNNQAQAMLYGGYSRSWDHMYLAAEIFASVFSNTSINYKGQVLLRNIRGDVSENFNTNLQTSLWQYGFDLRPGYLITPFTCLYGRVGLSAVELEAFSNALSTVTLGINSSVPSNVSVSKWDTAFRLGLGLEQLLSSQFHLRADYIFTNYGIISFKDTKSGQDNLGNVVTVYNTFSSHVQNNAIILGLLWYFH
ncbi:MAG: outer membrane beta-barrel protein [Verrucomicrobia bacterium]|nr:outer membrane beta-barrel protein [Verrucomicrobiota bacterium]